MKTLKKGFTLIELLIVIAILGILAIVVLSALNPIEQINKSRDAGNVSDAEQLLGATDRYFAATGLYPWQDVTTDTRAVAWGAVTPTFPTSPTETMMDNLSVNTVELKLSFVDRVTAATGYNPLFIYNSGDIGDATYVCFNPQSDTFTSEATARCTSTPTDFPASACANATDCADDQTNSCYCIP